MEAYIKATSYLPPRIRKLAQSLTPEQQNIAEEFRLRAGRPFCVTLPDKTIIPDKTDTITPHDIEMTAETVTHGSIHTVLDRICNGFITMEGGHRLGLCGTAVIRDGGIVNLRDFSSCCLRIARQKIGASAIVLPELWTNNQMPNVLILSPPGGGKTTLLRDMLRALSNGDAPHAPLRVAIADERGEVAGCCHGVPQLDVGVNTDVLDAAPKAAGALMLLRALSPQVIALDEITTQEDIEAMMKLCNCGVSVIATAHAEGIDDLLRRPLYKPLTQISPCVVTVKRQGTARKYIIERLA